MALPLGYLTLNTTCTINSLVRSKASLPRTNDLTCQSGVGDRQNKTKIGTLVV